MPDDLLEFVSGPPGYSPIWLWFGIALLILVIAWYALVFVATMPSQQLRRLPGVERAHARVLRNRFAATVRTLTQRHRAGELSAEQAGAAISATLRSFLYQATGTRAQYLQVRAIAAGELAAAAPILEALGSAQFDRTSTVDVGRLGEATEELIRSWT
ncbi:hypothetical protein [Mycolicibacterium parafortuitum]|uniref:DUF4381 domain-containing protein n=1 Tax=Mycolicibacterium parafortuitum TaxID=39692 RepID=A0A375YFY1_MYCPF|nr:hypothetical protein [Mycolicibacterium parafortuitum]ORB28906.1 hypothetical protein BST38_18265 [Mycolicibacterium parafortuitum]PQE01656.1 hypothetical protein CYL16_06235 [Mycobacterium sp. EPG1]BBY73727.1 hypothetical protein MPRF_06260 [Mycolicibacterium parafortuitum]SRX79974.1 hypothetical protein MPP7335_01712 [Mycolicibacterium parafortuitum]